MKKIIPFLTILTILFIASCEKEPNPEDIVTGRFVYLEDGNECQENIGIFIDVPYVYFEKSEIPRNLRNDKDTINIEIVYHQIIENGNSSLCPLHKIDYIKKMD